MSDVSRPVYRGILIQDPRITGAAVSGSTGASTCSYTQAGQLPGVPVSTNSGDDMVLRTSGTPTNATASYSVRTRDAGFPGRGRAKYVWQREGDSGWYGWDRPSVPTAFEVVAWTTGVAEPFSSQESDAVTLSDGTVLVACRQTIAPATTSAVRVYARDPVAHTWNAGVTVHSTSGTGVMHPCLVLLPDDRVLVFFWVYDTDADRANIRAEITEDKGATWTPYSPYVLEVSIDTTEYTLGGGAGRLRGCYLNGDVLLIALMIDGVNPNWLFQWGSHDLGGNFQLVEKSASKRMQDVTVCDGGILVAHIDYDERGIINVRAIGAAYQPLSMSAVLMVDATGPGYKFDELAIWTDDDGIVYLAAVDDGTVAGQGLIWQSMDAGATFENAGTSEAGDYGQWYRTEASAPAIPMGLAATSQGGRQLLFMTVDAPDSDDTGDDSLCCIYLGGYSNQTLPYRETFKTRNGQVGFDEHWYGWAFPDSHSTWTLGGTAACRTNGGGYLQIGTTSDTCYFTATTNTSPSLGLVAEFEMQVASGTGPSVRFSLYDGGSSDIELQLSFSTTQITITDTIAPATLATVAADMDGDYVAVRVYMLGSGVAVYFREGASTVDARAWTLAYSTSGALTPGAAIAGADRIRWGHPGTSTGISRWRRFHWTDGDQTGRVADVARTGGQNNPVDLGAKDYSPYPYWLADGQYIQAIDGPTAANSTWTIAPRYEYGIDRILPTVERSPSVGWRSTVDSVTTTIAYRLAASGDTELLNDSVALYVDGCNFQYVTLYAYSSGAPVSLGTLDLSSGTASLTYVHKSGAVRAGSGTEVANRYYTFNELVGGTFAFATGARRRILGNTEGFWQGAASGATKQVTLWLDGIDGDEDGSGDTGEIWYPRGVMVCHLAGQTAQAYTLSIQACVTVDGFYTLGQMVVGPIVVFGRDYDWNRKLGLVPQTSLVTNDSGNRRARRYNRPRRTVELPWTGGVDLSRISGTLPSDDYVKGSTTTGSLPIALRNDTPLQLAGLLDYLGGSNLPCVYLPRIPKGPPDAVSMTPRELSLYGCIVSDWAAEVVLGHEWAGITGEVVRVPGVTIEEEV